MAKKRWMLIAACLLAATGCSKKEEEKETEAVAPVEVAPIREESIRRLVTAEAVLFPRDQASVTPKISAPVLRFLVNRGDHVRQGQLLAVLESRDLAAAAAEAKSQLAQAESAYKVTAGAALPEEVRKSQLEEEAARQGLEAAQKLYDSRLGLFNAGALARRQVDEAQVALAQARSQHETAQEHLRNLQSVSRDEQAKGAAAQVEAARSRSESAQAQLSYAEIHSPIAGVIADRPVYAGEMANAGSPLVTVVDISSIVARANVPQNLASSLQVGNPAILMVGEGGSTVHGKVTVVSPAADPNTTTVQVWVEAPNPGEKLKPGTSVRVQIEAGVVPKALVVPPEAVLPGAEGGSAVLVVGSDSVAHLKKITPGLREDDKVQITGEVTAGQRVVVVGGVGVEDGAKVKIVQPGAKDEDTGEKEKEDEKEKK